MGPSSLYTVYTVYSCVEVHLTEIYFPFLLQAGGGYLRCCSGKENKVSMDLGQAALSPPSLKPECASV